MWDFLSSILTEDATGRCRGAKAARLGSCLELDIVDTVAGNVLVLLNCCVEVCFGGKLTGHN